MMDTTQMSFQRHRNSIVIAISLFLFSCGKGINDNIRKEFFPNGNIKSEITYVNDTLKEGKAVYYYDNGTIGRICYYKKNKIDSFYVEYYPNGMVNTIGMYRLANSLGTFLYYYSNGKLELYNAKDQSNETFYVMKFDSSGNKLNEEGVVISPNVASPDYKKKYLAGDSVILEYSIAEPPGYKAKMFVGLFKYENSDKALIDSFRRVSLDAWSQGTYKNRLNDTGHYRIICVGQLIDTVSNYMKSDTAHTDVFVFTN